MARRPSFPDGDRFFARVEGARLECPRCGYLDRFGTIGTIKRKIGDPLKKRKRKGVKGRPNLGWNPLVSQWRCPQCFLTFTIGLIAWPVVMGSGQGTVPTDQVPNYRQLGQLRAQGDGVWMREPLTRYRAEGSNITKGCTCDPACVVHGEEAESPEEELKRAEGAEGLEDPLSPSKTPP